VLFAMLDAHEVALTGPERRALHLTIDLAVRERFAARSPTTCASRYRTSPWARS
jgi:hypothetical protein